MKQVVIDFAEETARHLRALQESMRQMVEAAHTADGDPTETMSRLSPVRQSFDQAASLVEQRLALLESAIPAGDALRVAPARRPIPPDLLQIFWLVLTGLAAVSFAAGFYFGSHP